MPPGRWFEGRRRFRARDPKEASSLTISRFPGLTSLYSTQPAVAGGEAPDPGLSGARKRFAVDARHFVVAWTFHRRLRVALQHVVGGGVCQAKTPQRIAVDEPLFARNGAARSKKALAPVLLRAWPGDAPVQRHDERTRSSPEPWRRPPIGSPPTRGRLARRRNDRYARGPASTARTILRSSVGACSRSRVGARRFWRVTSCRIRCSGVDGLGRWSERTLRDLAHGRRTTRRGGRAASAGRGGRALHPRAVDPARWNVDVRGAGFLGPPAARCVGRDACLASTYEKRRPRKHGGTLPQRGGRWPLSTAEYEQQDVVWNPICRRLTPMDLFPDGANCLPRWNIAATEKTRICSAAGFGMVAGQASRVQLIELIGFGRRWRKPRPTAASP